MEESHLLESDKQLLLTLARASVEFGLDHREELQISELDHPQALRAKKATFVTLRVRGDLHGCVGTTSAVRPLVVDVVHNAFHAAFYDTRFPPLTRKALADLDVHISILSPLEQLHCTSQEDLIGHLRPGIDGVVLEEGHLLATFLPVMWEQLPDPEEFLRHLRQKAQLPESHWSGTLRVFRYTTQSVP